MYSWVETLSLARHSSQFTFAIKSPHSCCHLSCAAHVDESIRLWWCTHLWGCRRYRPITASQTHTHVMWCVCVCVYPYPNKAHVTHVQYNCLYHLTIWHHADLTRLSQVKRWNRSHSTWQKSHVLHLSLPFPSPPILSPLCMRRLWMKVHLLRTGVHLSCGE